MTREEMRMAFWCDVYTTKGSDFTETKALELADQALEQFDKRFLPQREIKETGDLGMTLDTERPWIKLGDKLPEVDKDVEVMLEDNTTDIGWRGTLGYWYARQGHESDNWEHWARSKKTVIAWRFLPTKTEE
jgi:hypothetical protein